MDENKINKINFNNKENKGAEFKLFRWNNLYTVSQNR